MIQDILDMIAAVRENIVVYQEMGDEAAVRAAQGMIADFEEIIAHEMDMLIDV